MSAQTPVWVVAVAICCSATFFGLNIGLASVVMQFHKALGSNCPAYRSQSQCEALPSAGCAWRDGACAWEGLRAVCGTLRTYPACSKNPACSFDGTMCFPTGGWTKTQQGSYASSLIVGSVVGVTIVTPLKRALRRSRFVLLIGLTAVFTSALAVVAEPTYGVLLVSRVGNGVVAGMSVVAFPRLVTESIPDSIKAQSIGVLFQLFITFGICVSAFMGLKLTPRQSDHGSAGGNGLQQDAAAAVANLRYLVLAVHTVVGSLLVAVSPLMYNDAFPPGHSSGASDSTPQKEAAVGSVGRRSPVLPGKQAAGPTTGVLFATAVLLSFCNQFTGINAIMNYAPDIITAAGLEPMTGNFVIMLWNFVVTIIAVPLARRYQPRSSYLVGLFFAGVACCVTGVGALPPSWFPTILSASTRKFAGTCGIFMFISSFAVCMGPNFFILAQEIFPLRLKDVGSSVANLSQNLFNLMINFGYPFMVVELDVLTSSNQHHHASGVHGKGEAAGAAFSFFIFGFVGLVGAMLLRGMFATVLGGRPVNVKYSA